MPKLTDIQTADVFHQSQLGTLKCRVWRRNGKTRTWKKDPTRFEIPVKFGMYAYGQLTRGDFDTTKVFHLPVDCPLNIATGPMSDD